MENAVICPLCGNNNKCAMTTGNPPESCWCRNAVFPHALLAKVPADRIGKACICKHCLDRFRLTDTDV